MEILQSIWASIISILNDSGLLGLFQGDGWKNAIMIGIACFLLYLAIGRQFEPLLLLPIAFGMLLVNLPLSWTCLPQNWFRLQRRRLPK